VHGSRDVPGSALRTVFAVTGEALDYTAEAMHLLDPDRTGRDMEGFVDFVLGGPGQ
jgi:hypothetical protein